LTHIESYGAIRLKMPDVKDFVPELVCLGIDVVCCGAFYAAYHNLTRIVSNLREAPEISVDATLKEQITNHPMAKSMEDGSIRVPYAVVQGEVTPMGKTVSSVYSTESLYGVIQKVVFREHKRSLSRTGFWFDSERVIHQYTNDAPFYLTQPQNTSLSLSKPRIEVIDWPDAFRIDLDTVYDKFEQGTNTLGSHLMGWVQGDMHRGSQVTESMLLKGTTLTAIGEVVSSPMGIKIIPPTDEKPFFLVKNTVSSLIKEYESGRSMLKVFVGVFTGVGLFISVYAAYKYYTRRKQELVNLANEETINVIRSERVQRETPEDIPEHRQCVVCLSAEREIILLRCGHVCACADCGRELVRNGHPCPVCRAVIESVLPAYVS